MNQDMVIPDGKWEFNDEVTKVFDDMLKRSIPQYEVMREAVTDLAQQYAVPQTDIVDLGCSRGEGISRLIDYLPFNTFVGVEISEPMRKSCIDRFSNRLPASKVRILNLDLRHRYPACSASVTLAVLTIQFTPIEYRQQILKNIYDHTEKGGALIVVEKVLGGCNEINELLVDQYYSMKNRNGYTHDQIDRKRLSLEGVLVPVTAKWNEEMLQSAGFSRVECFWRWMNFAGWVALK